MLLLLPVIAMGQNHQAFQLDQVKLKEGPFLKAQQADLDYILSLDPDRLLHPFLREAGLDPKADSYGNWEGTGLDGHIGGHYLSALSLMYAATGNAEIKRRLDYMVDELARCQEKNSNGYVGGIPQGKAMWEAIGEGRIDAASFSLNGKWVPLYNIHKLYAGLYDAAVIGKNEKARRVFLHLCQWFSDLTKDLSPSQFQEMLRSEHGGMNEVFANAFELTGDEQYLQLARNLSHEKILNPLSHNRDSLTGLHANTQIPKVVGFQKMSTVTDGPWTEAAEFFWNTVVHHRTVSIGGNSVREHFHPANDFSSMIESNQGPETCNTYNMMRLTRGLFLSKPDASFIDYYERAMFNHILSSQHPDRGGFVYFTPMRPRHYRVYSHPQKSFWCCVGSGLENHAKYGELVYSHEGANLFVNLFLSSSLHWKEKGVVISQDTQFPFSETSVITVKAAPSEAFAIHIRYPSWVKEGALSVKVNGKAMRISAKPSSYVELKRKWKNGDVIQVNLPMHTKVEYLPDNSPWASFVHGPIVLAAPTDSSQLKGLIADDSRMGHVAEGEFLPIDRGPVLVKRSDLAASVKPVAGKPLTFTFDALVQPEQFKSLRLVPFFTVHDVRYIIYWPVASPQELVELQEKLAAKEKEQQLLRERTIDEVVAGEQQPEVEHRFEGKDTETGSSQGRAWRNARGWFRYELRDPKGDAAILRVVYNKTGWNRRFDILLNDKLLRAEVLPDSFGEGSYFVDYPLPAWEGHALSVTFKAHENASTAGIHSVHLLRK